MIDSGLILRVTPTKTEQTSAASIEVDLSECPMVVEELSKIPVENRRGPLIVNPKTGLPYRQWYFRDLWRKCARLSGIPDTMWNRDLRAGGNTEGQRAGAPVDDRKKLWVIRQCRGSLPKSTTAISWKPHVEHQGREWRTGLKTKHESMSHTVAHCRAAHRNISRLRSVFLNGPLTPAD